MVKSQTLITFLPLLLLSSIAAATTTTATRPVTLNRRGLTTICNPLFGTCSNQWPFSPITSGNNHFISRPFLRHSSPPSVVVPSPPPPVFTNPYFTTPSYHTNPSFSPLVASPPPPGGINTIPPVLPELPPADGGVIAAPPYLALSFSPPTVNLPPVNNLPPIAGKDRPEVFMSPPEEHWPEVFNVPPTPLVPVDSQLTEDAGKLPPVGETAVVESPPGAN